MKDKKHHETFAKLLVEAAIVKVNIGKLITKAFEIGWNMGYDSALKRYEDELLN